jgi:uncharacterized protein (DUF488 family)
METTLYTIGFAKKSARTFFTLLKQNHIARLIDIRLNNSSQLAGYTKKEDLQYFLESICNCLYLYIPEFAPSKEILDNYKENKMSWAEYELKYNLLIAQKAPHKTLKIEELNKSCLLCAEPIPDKCHRRLAAEYLQKQFSGISIEHL